MRLNLHRGMLFAAVPAFCSFALAGDSTGSASDSKSQLDSASFGEVWYGPSLGTEDLKGHVVLMDFWGIH